jgi:hypothetical protein
MPSYISELWFLVSGAQRGTKHEYFMKLTSQDRINYLKEANNMLTPEHIKNELNGANEERLKNLLAAINSTKSNASSGEQHRLIMSISNKVRTAIKEMGYHVPVHHGGRRTKRSTRRTKRSRRAHTRRQ